MVGEIIQVKGIDLLVLDEINGNPFVVAMDLGIETEFDEDSNNYDGSVIEKKTNDWLIAADLPAVERELDLMTLDGCKDYGKKMVKAAPLTLDEYRKYSDIIVPHIKDWFWLCTGWSTRSRFYNIATSVCGVNYNGIATGYNYSNSSGLAPALILDKAKLGFISGESLKNVSTEALIAELNRRFNK